MFLRPMQSGSEMEDLLKSIFEQLEGYEAYKVWKGITNSSGKWKMWVEPLQQNLIEGTSYQVAVRSFEIFEAQLYVAGVSIKIEVL